MRRSSFFLFAALAACGGSGDVGGAESTMSSASGSAAARFLGDALAGLSSYDAAFFLNRGTFRGEADRTGPRVLGGTVDRASGTFTLQFDALAGPGLAPSAVPSLERIFTFELPRTSLVEGASLDQPPFARALGDAASRAQAARRRDGPPTEFVDSLAHAEERRDACARAGYPVAITSTIVDAEGADVDVAIDCHYFRRQNNSQMTPTPFELASLVVYTGNEFSAINRLLRSRTFNEPDPDFATDPQLKERATEALWALAA